MDGGKAHYGPRDAPHEPRVPPGLVGIESHRDRGRARRSRRVEIFACTGFVVGTPRGQEVVTARHCLKSRAGMRIFDARTAIQARDALIPTYGADVALVRLAGASRFPEVTLGDSRRLRHGERLCAWRVREEGKSLYWDRACGRFLGRSVIDAGRGAHPVLLIEHVLAPGFSGGPVVDAAGHVIGVGVAAADDQEYDAVEPIEAVVALAGSGAPAEGPQALTPQLPQPTWAPTQAAGAAENPAGAKPPSGTMP
jgi:hypothetical protein